MNKNKLSVLLILVSLLAFSGSAQDVYYNADVVDYTVSRNSVSVDVENYFMDNGGSNSGDFSTEVYIQVGEPDGDYPRYNVKSCGKVDYLARDESSASEPDDKLDSNGDSHPDNDLYNQGQYSNFEQTSFSRTSGITVPEGSDLYLQGSGYWSDGSCSGGAAGQFSVKFADNVQLNDAPSGSLSVNDTNIMEGDTVEFTFSGSDSDGSVQSMEIDFGDGQTSPSYSSDGTVEHTYSASGSYSAELTVTDDDGATATDSASSVSVDPDCNFLTSTAYTPPYPDTAVVGEDMDVNFIVLHNGASNCPDPSDLKFEACGTNLTAPDHIESTTWTYGTLTYDAFNASFTVQSDVTCNSPTNTVKYWNTLDGSEIATSTLSIIRGSVRGAPIHENGNYKPQAEIIVATEMSHPRTDYYDLQNENVANKSDTKFFVCRGNYRGQDISSSKLVKVQEGTSGSYSWQHYRCAMNGTWQEASCEPGRELRQEPNTNDYRCFMKATQTITATYFNIQDIPHSGKTNGYIAGFKIPESDISTYEDVMGFKPQKVDAECWMGDDNQRPSNSSNSVVFTSTYDGSGDLWALAEIPPRSGVNKNTYSCVWGIKNVGSTADTNVYESTNNIPLKAKDGGRTDIQYNTIESRRTSADIDTGTPRSVWDHYKSKSDTPQGRDERSYISGSDEFMLNDEVEYCSTNTYWAAGAGVLQNIICG